MKSDICPWSKLITLSGKAGRWVACGRRRDGGDLARKWVLDNLFRAVQVLCSRINLKVWQVTPKLYFLPTLLLSIILLFHALFFLGIASLALSPSAEALVLPRFSGQTAHDLVSEEPSAVNRKI